MDQSRDTLKKEYKEFLLWPGLGVNEFEKHCIQFLEEHEVKSCFRFLPLNDIAHEFLEKAAETEDAKYHLLCNVFQQFEKYAARLVVKPWCKDLYTIKVYTGYFKYNFERWISTDTVYRVFELIGYKSHKTASPGTLILKPPTDEKRVLALGLELYLAHTQLYRLRNIEFLSSEYLMKDVMEGWMSTTGNPVNIVEWLGKNMLETKQPCGFKETRLSGTEAHEKTSSEFVTINGKVSHFDKNGHSVEGHVRYPPRFSEDEYIVLRSQQDENNASGNSSPSLVTVDLLDSVLYGGGDHDTSPLQNSKIASELHLQGSFSMPYLTTNGNYENVNGKDGIQFVYSRGECNGSSYQPKYNLQNESKRKDVLSSSSGQLVVSRGRNSEYDDPYSYENLTTDSSMYGHVEFNQMGHATHENSNDSDARMHSRAHGADEDILIDSKKFVKLLHNRIKNAEKQHENQNFMLKENFVRNIDDCKNSGPISTSYGMQQDVVGGSVKYENASERKAYEGPLSEVKFPITNTLSDVLNNSSDTCIVCGKPPAFGCKKCKEVACECCSKSLFMRRPCVESEHQCYRISSV